MPKKLAVRDENHRVTIRVWLASIRNGELGHSSLQTYGHEGIHASFWPRRNPRRGNPGFCDLRHGVPGMIMPMSTADKTLETVRAPDKAALKERGIRRPDIELDLYTLDVAAINTAFNKFQESNSRWSIYGGSFFGASQTQNCSGLVAFLLYKGGFSKLIKSYASTGRVDGSIIGAIILGLIGALTDKKIASTKGQCVAFSLFATVLGKAHKFIKYFSSSCCSNCFPYLLFATGLGAVSGCVLGGLIGGAIDGVYDGAEIGKTVRAAGKGYEVFNKFIGGLICPCIGAVPSAFFIDHLAHKVAITPGHIADLIRFAQEVEAREFEYVTQEKYDARTARLS